MSSPPGNYFGWERKGDWGDVGIGKIVTVSKEMGIDGGIERREDERNLVFSSILFDFLSFSSNTSLIPGGWGPGISPSSSPHSLFPFKAHVLFLRFKS